MIWLFLAFLKSRNNSYPSNWPRGLKGKNFEKINVTGNTFNLIVKRFNETMQRTVTIVNIEKVCNLGEYDRKER